MEEEGGPRWAVATTLALEQDVRAAIKHLVETWQGTSPPATGSEGEAFCQTMLDTQTEGWLDSLTRFQLGGGARILQPRLPHPLLMPVSHVDGAPRPPHTPHRLPECRVAAHEMREMMFGADSIMQPAPRAAPKWEALGR